MELDGRTLTMEIGKIAKQANGAVLVRYGDTAVVVAVTGTKTPREGVDFFPLTVDFEEKMYAVGKIPGGFIKREGRPGEQAILTSRLIDRPIRPMFPDGYHNDVQIVATAVSVDPDNAPDMPAMIGASCALSISDIPFEGPIAGVRVGLVDGEFVINPTVEQAKVSLLNLAVAGTKDAILMVEAGAKEVSEETMLDAIWFAHGVIKELVAFQEKIMAEVGKPKMEVPVYEPPAEIAAEIEAYGADKLKEALMDANKLEREENVAKVKAEIAEVFIEKYPDNAKDVAYITQKLVKKIVRRTISVDKIRPDGRQLDEVRPVTCEVGLLARPHGSALFTRGQTQILNVLALAPLREAQILDGLGVEDTKRYIHHYNFPPYSVGETKPMRSPGRREIGHGNLALRALKRMIPEDFPYTVRVVSDILESNGSSSMATVCAGTLALMDAGVPMKKPVSGIAMGLIKNPGEEKYAVLSDILGDEDHLGDMDFKTTGTIDGLTATQMDIKCDGLSYEILEKALMQAKAGREHILGKLTECMPAPRAELKPHVPRIVQITIPKEFIGAVIGPGGKIIQGIQEETGAVITIEETDGVGVVQVSGANKDVIDAALGKIKSIVAVPEVGEVYDGVIRSVMPYGAFVEFMPGRDGLLHISEIDWKRLETVEEAGLKEGDHIQVKLVDIDQKTGKFKLSRRVLLEKPEGYVERPARRERPERGERRERRPRNDEQRGE